jgi:hypothetical protein
VSTTAAGNTISNNVQCGVALDNAGQGNTLDPDAVENNGFGQPTAGIGDGVSIVDSAYTSAIDCTIESNRDWGILVKGISHFVLNLDTVLNNGLGSILIS